MYNISKGQLWVLILGASLLTFLFLIQILDGDSNGISEVGLFLLPFSVVFYIVGWKNHRRRTDQESNLIGERRVKLLRWLKMIILGWIILSLVVTAITYLYYYAGDGLSFSQQREMGEYIGTMSRLPKHIENANACVDKYITTKLEEQTNSCQEKYDNVYANYQDCMSFGTGHNFCSNLHNYEEFDCSEEAISKNLKDEVQGGCFRIATSEFLKITAFEEDLTDSFMERLPSDQAVLSTETMESLYSLFPDTVFNEKTKGRLDSYIESKGYTIQEQ
jgi:Ca2+/Na+ antiporter